MRFLKWPVGEEEGYVFWCPGCDTGHSIRSKGPTVWQVIGSGDYLTISPSILVRLPEHDNFNVCHSYVKEGRIQFLADCTHALKGQTVDIPDWPDSYAVGGEMEEK